MNAAMRMRGWNYWAAWWAILNPTGEGICREGSQQSTQTGWSVMGTHGPPPPRGPEKLSEKTYSSRVQNFRILEKKFKFLLNTKEFSVNMIPKSFLIGGT